MTDQQETDIIHLYDGWRCIEEREFDENGEEDDAWEARRQYVFGSQYIDEPLIFDKGEDEDGDCTDDPGTGSNRYYYLQDSNYNVVALANSSGTVVERCWYEPYGTVTFTDSAGANPSTTSSKDNTLTFQGRRLDSETGLYYFRNRYYSPVLGRFIARDPIFSAANLYNIARGRVVTYLDPLGLLEIKKIAGVTPGSWARMDIDGEVPICSLEILIDGATVHKYNFSHPTFPWAVGIFGFFQNDLKYDLPNYPGTIEVKSDRDGSFTTSYTSLLKQNEVLGAQWTYTLAEGVGFRVRSYALDYFWYEVTYGVPQSGRTNALVSFQATIDSKGVGGRFDSTAVLSVGNRKYKTSRFTHSRRKKPAATSTISPSTGRWRFRETFDWQEVLFLSLGEPYWFYKGESAAVSIEGSMYSDESGAAPVGNFKSETRFELGVGK